MHALVSTHSNPNTLETTLSEMGQVGVDIIAEPNPDHSMSKYVFSGAEQTLAHSEQRRGGAILLACLDHLTRLGFHQCLRDSNEFRIAAEPVDQDGLVRSLIGGTGALLVMDGPFCRTVKEDFIMQQKDMYPDLHVLLLCTVADDVLWLRAIERGASCYLTTSGEDELIHALREVSSGRQYVPDVLMQIRGGASARLSSSVAHHTLSKREGAVFQLIVLGKTTKEISYELHVSASTVCTYRTRILKKLQLQTTADLVAYAVRQNIRS